MSEKETIGLILDALGPLEGVQQGQWSRGEWTRQVLTQLCRVGQNLGFSVCASRVDGADWGEWVWDVCWLAGKKNLRSVAMAGECEWDDVEHIKEDFQKLLVARASLRVMVCDGWWQPGCDDTEGRATAERLQRWVGEFEGGSEGDKYLLIIYEWHEKRRRSWRYRLTAADVGELPTLERL